MPPSCAACSRAFWNYKDQLSDFRTTMCVANFMSLLKIEVQNTYDCWCEHITAFLTHFWSSFIVVNAFLLEFVFNRWYSFNNFYSVLVRFFKSLRGRFTSVIWCLSTSDARHLSSRASNWVTSWSCNITANTRPDVAHIEVGLLWAPFSQRKIVVKTRQFLQHPSCWFRDHRESKRYELAYKLIDKERPQSRQYLR